MKMLLVIVIAWTCQTPLLLSLHAQASGSVTCDSELAKKAASLRTKTKPKAKRKSLMAWGLHHTGSVIMMGAGLALASGALVFGILTQQKVSLLLIPNPPASSQQAAHTNAAISTALWISSGALLTAGTVWLISTIVLAKTPPRTHVISGHESSSLMLNFDVGL